LLLAYRAAGIRDIDFDQNAGETAYSTKIL